MSAKQGVTSSQSAGPKFGLFPIPSLLVATRTFLPASPHPPSHNDTILPVG